MASYRDKTVLVYDHGLFIELARRLRKDFGRVLYYSPWEGSFPKTNEVRIGEGIREIERVREIWSSIDEVDLFVFPDVYEGALQQFLADRLGKRVWGARLAEDLELNRAGAKEHCAAVGIDIGPYEVVTGLEALRAYLEEHDDVYVKISTTRGDMETFHAENYKSIEPRLNELAHTLDAGGKVMDFVVEQAIPDAIEVGYDGYTVDGRFPKDAIVGVEVKDKAYACCTMPYSDLPDTVRGVNDCLGPTLEAYGMRGFMSTEVRATKDGSAFLIDPCMRCGSPPSELYMMMIDNLADVIWEGAGGTLVDPKFVKPYGAQLLLLSDWADKNWQQVEFPKSIRDHVKLRNFTVIDGQHYVVPQWSGMPEIGAVVAMGDTQDAAIAECRRIAEQVEGYSIEKPDEALDEAGEQLDAYLAKTKRAKGRTERQAEDMAKAGKVSPRQLERLREKV